MATTPFTTELNRYTRSQLTPVSTFYGKPNAVLDRTPTSITLSAGSIYFGGIFFLDRPITITKFHTTVQAAVATSVYRCGIYTLDLATRKPVTMVADGGGTNLGDATGPQTITLASPVTLPVGWYTEAVLAKTANPTLSLFYGLDNRWAVGSGTAFTGAYRWVTDAAGQDAASALIGTAPANTIQSAANQGWYHHVMLEYTNA